MKIIVLVRTRNEELNIERFIESYPLAYKILVADGGSNDRTIELAQKYKNVEVRNYTDKVYRNGAWRNGHGAHINFLIDWGESYNPDFLVFDDCDCVPNYHMRHDFIKIFEDAEDAGVDFILANRVYIYGRDKYFKSLTCPKVIVGQYENEWIPSLWAWKANKEFRAKEDDPFKHEFNKTPTDHPRKELYPPYCLLHFFYPNDEYMRKKIDFYANIRELAEDVPVRDPKEYGGSLLKLEEWMRE